MKRLDTFLGIAVVVQILVLLVPGYYSWANVGGLFIFAAVYCFNAWLGYCSNKREEGTEKRLEFLEKETSALNAALAWRNK